MIDNLDGLLKAIVDNSKFQRSVGDIKSQKCDHTMSGSFDESLFCPKCSAQRQQSVRRFSGDQIFKIIKPSEEITFQNLPIIHIATCLQCQAKTILILYQGPEVLELTVLHDTYGGCVTPNSPQEVKYYIDQAFRAKSVNALSASMAMYRSALEWALYEQGYQNGMLGGKILALEKEINDGKAPKWAMDMPPVLLKAIKDIGNGAIHTNGGDITKQKEIDKTLIELVDVVFAELLDVVYEQPLRRTGNLSKLQNIASKLKL